MRVFPLYVRAENPFDFQNEDHLNKIPALKYDYQLRRNASEGSWSALKAIQSQIKAAGFDSYYEMEMGQLNLGVFNPNQLKSAISNTGEYSLKNNNISYSLTDEDLGTSIKRPSDTEVRTEVKATKRITKSSGPKGRDVFARSLEDIKLSIPANERWIGTKLPGQPVRAPDGRRFLEHDLNKKTGPMNLTQAAIDQAWASALEVTGPAASRALSELQTKGITMRPPGEAHWKAAENLPNKDRVWYEISAEAMTESFPDFSRDELGKTMDVVAATSPLADPNYNGRLAISILAEDFQKTPSVTPAVVPSSVKDAILGEFGKAEQRKVGSFGGTFRFLEGMSDDPPLTTNDRQVAASMGIPDSAFGTYPVLYELQSRFINNLRDHVNASGGMNSELGPFQSHQLQALSWVQTRAEARLKRRINITEEEAFNGDAYASSFKLAAKDLREAGINVPEDPTTGLPKFTAAVLSNPKVQQILTPPGTEFLKSTIQTMEVNTKLREVGQQFADALEESKRLGIVGNIKLAERVLQRAAKALALRTSDAGDRKLPSALSKLASVFGALNADLSRIEFGRGTFEGDVNPNIRIPMDVIPEKYRKAFMAVLGKQFYQAAQAASKFTSVEPSQAKSYSIWMHRKGTMDGLENLAKALTDEGHEANISQRPNGVLIDVHPKFTDTGPVPIDPIVLETIADSVLGSGNSSVIPREYESIYLERQEYDSTILQATKELLDEHAQQLSQAAAISLRAGKNYLRGDANRQVEAGTVPLNSRAEKIRNSYRKRINQLQSSQRELKSLFNNFEKDTRLATSVMQKRLGIPATKAGKELKVVGEEDAGLSTLPIKGSTPGVLDNQLGPRYSLMDEPISPRFSEVQMAWNKGEMTREEYDQAMAELVKNPEGIEYPASGPAIDLVETMERTIGGTNIVDLPTVYKSIIEVLQTLGDNAVLRTGRYAGAAAGLYKEFENVIRLRRGMDRAGLPVVVHELGHSIAKSIFGTAKSSALRQSLRYDPKNLPVVTQLEGLGKKLYGKTRPAIGYTGEGFAEFVRLWMSMDPALKDYGQTTAWFEKTFITDNPSLGATINEAKRQLTLWRLQGARDRSRAMSSPPKALDTLLYKLRRESSFATRVEELAPLELLSNEYRRRTGITLKANEDPFILASALRGTAGGVLHSWVTLGITDIYGRQVGPSLKEAYALIKPSQEEDFRRYLWSLQSQIRLKQGIDPGKSLADADFEIAELSIKYPHFVKAALDISKWWDKALDYQLMAFPEMNYQLMAAIRKANPVYYGPLMRQFTEEEKRNNQVRGSTYVIREAKGSGRKIENLFLSSVRMAEGIIAKGQKDMVLKAVTDLVKTEGMGWLIEKVAVGKVMKMVNIESIREQLESYGVDTSKLSTDAMLQCATNADAGKAKDPIISIRRSTPTATDPNASTLEWYQVPREIADVLQGVQEVGRLNPWFEAFVGAPTRIAKMGYVSLSVPFQVITNPIRDTFTLFLAARNGNALEVGMGLMKAYGQLAKGALVQVTSKEFRDKYMGGLAESEASLIAQRLGISNSTFIGGDIQEAKRLKTFLFHGKVFTTLASPIESLRSALSFSETAPRLSQLELAITKLGWKAGDDLTPEQAIAGMLAYKRATVDFTAHGTDSPYFRRGFLGPFYNASLQGSRTFVRALPLRSDPKRFATALLTGITMMTVPVLFNWYKYKDEEWWTKLPWREKFLYLHIVVGDEVVRIPMPQDFGALFMALPIAAMDAMNQENPEAVKALFGHIFTVGNPAALPVPLRAGVEYGTGRTFYGSPIVPADLQKDQPGSQFTEDTGWIAQKLGQMFPATLSPIKIEYLVKSVAGSVGLNTIRGPELLAELMGLKKEGAVREPDAADTWFYGRIYRPGGKFSASSVPIIDFFDDFDQLEARKISEGKAVKAGKTPINPFTNDEQIYYSNLKGRRNSVITLLGLARSSDLRSDRQNFYKEAAILAEAAVKTKPKNRLLPW